MQQTPFHEKSSNIQNQKGNTQKGHKPQFLKRIKNMMVHRKIAKDAIQCAIDECIEKGILVDILTEQRKDVTKMILSEYYQELHEQHFDKNKELARKNQTK